MRAATSHHRAGRRRPRQRSVGAFLAAVVILLALMAPAGAAHAASAVPDQGKPWLGAVLEWGEDTAAGFSGRLGASPAVFGHDLAFPFRDSDRNNIEGFLQQAGAKGAHAMLTASLLREAMWSMVSEVHSNLDFDFVAYTAENMARFERAWTEHEAMG